MGAVSEATRTDTDLYKVVSSNRMSEAIVQQIRGLIRSEQLRPGDRLPSERELGERTGVSRVTIREALRVLEASGLVEIRVGARGGAFVTTPSLPKIGTGLADLISLSPLTAAEVTEARQVFELGSIPLIVQRATDDDIAELRDMVARHQAALKRGAYDLTLSAAFHVKVAACAHNAAIEALAHSFHGPLLMSLREAAAAAPLMGHRGVAEHRDLVEAIAARDGARAHEIMRVHLERTARRVARKPLAAQRSRT
jgi:GntR family transcriptional regulator, transcriptional repressor for pyruvate dehydrogenase complex